MALTTISRYFELMILNRLKECNDEDEKLKIIKEYRPKLIIIDFEAAFIKHVDLHKLKFTYIGVYNINECKDKIKSILSDTESFFIIFVSSKCNFSEFCFCVNCNINNERICIIKSID